MPSTTPMQVLARLSPEGAQSYMSYRASIMDNANLTTLSNETKLLIGIGVASALQSGLCTLMWTKQARQAGVSAEAVVEAILVARLMKSATVNDAASEALEWLAAQEPEDAGGSAH